MMEPAIELKLLGTLSVRVHGDDAALPASRKTRALLAYLAVTGRAQRRDHLCELFWKMPDDPRGALRWSLSKLRRLVDEPDQRHLIADRDTVRLELPEAAVDFHRLRRLAEDDIGQAETGSLRSAETESGSFLEGLELPDCDTFNAWCIAQRESVRQWRIALLEELSGRNIDAEEAVSFARSWTMLDPYSAAAWQRLVRLLDRSDRKQEADQQRALAIRVLSEADVAIPESLRRKRSPSPGMDPVRQTHPGRIDQEVKFCASADGSRIAYSRIGEGPPLVWAGYWMNDLQRDVDSPIWRPWLDQLSANRSLLRYDTRGGGMSDREADQGVELYVDDLTAVADAAGLDRFDLYGMAQGAVTAITYAARNPQRVRRLVLQSSYARGWLLRREPQEIERRKAIITLATSGWAQNNQALINMFLGLYLPEADDAQCEWFEKFLQSAMLNPRTGELQEVLGHADVAQLAASIKTPTLVIHPRGEMIIPLAAGREVAALIPDAQLLTLDSSSHVIVPGDPVWPQLQDAIAEFLDRG